MRRSIFRLAAMAALCASASTGDEQPWQDIGMGGGDRYIATPWNGGLDGRPMNPLVNRNGNSLVHMGPAKNAVYSLVTPRGERTRLWALTPDGLYKTGDHGQTWTYIEESARTRLHMSSASLDSVRPVAVNPHDSAIVFVGTDEGRLYRTTNDGATWTECLYTSSVPGRATWRQGVISSVSIAVDDPSLVIVTNTSTGAFRSDDGGQNWRRLGDLLHPLHIAITPGRRDTLWASCAEEGLWRSNDGGATFRKVRLEENDTCMREVAIAHNRPTSMYAIGAIGHGGILYRSDDGGSTWQGNRRTIADIELTSLTGIWINPNHTTSIHLTSNWNVHISSDGGETISGPCVTGGSLPLVTEMLMHGGRLYAATAGSGLFQSAPGKAHWRQLVNPAVNQTLTLFICRIGIVQYRGETCIIATAVEDKGKGGPFVLIIGEDGRIIEKSRRGLPSNPNPVGTLWSGGAYPRGLAVFDADPRIVYLGMDGDDGGLFRSDNGGLTWRKSAGNPGSLRLHSGLAVDPRDASRVYWGTREPGAGVYLSTDAGASWQHVLADDVIILRTSASGVVYAGARNLHCSHDGGRTWKTLTALGEESLIVDIATDPRDEKRVWFSYADHGDKRHWTHVWQSSDGGASWTEITRNITGSHCRHLCYDPREDVLYGGLSSVFKLPLGPPVARKADTISSF
jgi:photosystem II stability/assembly factor-like uncharacterized protein